jgi:CIC family chloride channel protein
MGVVLARMGTRGLGRLPVVSREEPDRLLGMVRRADVIQAYQVALTRRAELQHRARRMQLRNIDGTEFIDIDLIDSDVIVGRRLSELASRIPADCILISVKRDGRVLIPHGDTMFQAGDKLTAFVRSQDVPSLLHWVHGLSETG